MILPMVWFPNVEYIFTRTVVGLASAAVFGANVISHGPLLRKYKAIVSLYENDEPAVLDENTLALAEKVMEDMELKEKEKKRISFFSVLGHDVFHAGGKNSPWGAIIGLPFHFQKEKKFDLNKLKLTGVDDFTWGIDGIELMESMRLSEKAMMFAIAREIFSSNIKDVIENALLAAGFLVLIPARLSQAVNNTFKTFRFPFRTRLVLYGINYLLGAALYYGLKQPTKHLKDKKCDELAAKISSEYLKGGIEFYERSLIKNKELRHLLGKKGEKLFTPEGNENYILLAPKLPITKRLQYLRELEAESNKASQ